MTRIERAARAMHGSMSFIKPEAWGDAWAEVDEVDRQAYRDSVLAILRAAEPELYQEPPTHWRAPVEATEKILDVIFFADGAVERLWPRLRDAHLKDSP